MNPIIKLDIDFEPSNEASAWTKAIRSSDDESTNRTRFSKRLSGSRLNASGAVSFAKFLLGSSGTAAPRGELVVRHRLRRLYLPNHTFERPAP